MNGVAVGNAMRERPAETLLLEPFPGSFNALGYFTARNATLELEEHFDDPSANAQTLSQYIFERDPGTLDLVTAMSHRYDQARAFMGRYPDGQERLARSVLEYFQDIHQSLTEGYLPTLTNTIISAHSDRPRNQTFKRRSTQLLNLPPIIQSRSLIWNEWAQDKTQGGEIDELFTDEIQRHGAKVAAGALLPAGNLWIEVGEGIERVRGNVGRQLELEKRWGFTYEDKEISWGLGQDDWFVMSHIAEKGILELATSLGPNMIDGMHLTDEVYVRSYKPIVELIDLNPHLDIRGILSDGSWIYSEELVRVFPDQHVSKIHDVAGMVVELGKADEVGLPIQALFATLNPERRAAYDVGEYHAGVAARFIDRDGMANVLKRFGITSPAT